MTEIKESGKVVLLTVPFGMSARNILRAGVFRSLKERCRRVVILSPLSRSEGFVGEFTAPNVVFYDLPNIGGWRTRLRSLFQDIWLFHYGRKTGSHNLLRRYERLKRENRQEYYRLAILDWLLSALHLWRVKSSLAGKLIFHHPFYSEILDKETPDLVLTTSPLVSEGDLLVMYLARRKGIPTAGFVHSWDNIAKESNPWILPDKLLVWNNIMKQQAISFLGYREGDICVTGVPQYDEYLYHTPVLSRSDYLGLKGIPPESRVITYTCGNLFYFPDEHIFIRDLIAMIDQGEFGDAVLMLRLHPKYNAERFKQLFRNYPKVFFDEGDQAFDASSLTAWSRDNNSSSLYASLIRNSDVVINLASTVTIDAAIFDRPVVNVAYDLETKDYWFSNARYYESTHYRDIVASGGARVAYNREELIKYIRMYLADPSVDREGRKRIVAEQCYQVDDRAAERITEALFNIIL